MMKTLVKLLGLLLIILIVVVLYIMTSTGFFRSIENSYTGSVTKITVPGAEDLAIDREAGFMIISSADRAGQRDGKPTLNGLYYMDLQDDQHKLKPIVTGSPDVVNPHGLSLIHI